MSFDRERIPEQAASLAVQGVYLGTSGWKHEGWMGQLYPGERYEYRGKLAKARFGRDCLRESAEVFKTVCVDAAYHTLPSQPYLERLPRLTSSATDAPRIWNGTGGPVRCSLDRNRSLPEQNEVGLDRQP